MHASADTSNKLHTRLAILGLGFRPFYLLAGLFALVAIPLWVATYTGVLPFSGYLHSLAWHQHEMLFGFAVAVIAGFLLTAVRNWTGMDTPTGGSLGLLALLWVMGRVFAFTGPALPAIAIDLLFLPVLAITIAAPISRSRNQRNYKLLIVLAALAIANLTYHVSYAGLLPGYLTKTTITAVLGVIAILIAIMAGRVIPAFTGNAIPAANPRHSMPVEIVAIGSLLLLLASDVLQPLVALPPVALASLCALSAVAHLVRLWLWDSHRSFGDALLLMLPVAYVWLPITLALRGLASLNALPVTAAEHAFTMGAMTSLMLAMMMRSALGHTGRALKAGRSEIIAFFLMQLAAIVRVTATIVGGSVYRDLIVVSGALWFFAFAVFLWRYAPMLVRPRIDGRPG